ncbi:MAG: DNA mismatch repair protein MutS [Actinophytocola sp.]|uniref:MutS-related protein n=1 Tax=Actinophytocola sp. TaxID=1872138 RepID=UPI00132C0849|nr:hypothetical protein [Actinophytocola sp.]MPZ85339.1 DNA mismatch repair protein MutS [Actinophytocola sp.]
MKVFLLYPDRDLDTDAARPVSPNERDLVQDLELDTVLSTMAAGDTVVLDTARQVLLAPETDPEVITFRQRVLVDCLAAPEVVRELYELAVDAIESERKVWYGIFRDHPETVLRRSVQVIELLSDSLRRLRQLSEQYAGRFSSAGFTRLFAMLREELGEEYLATVAEHLEALRFRRGMLMSAALGTGNKGVRYVLHRPPRRSWWDRLTGPNVPVYRFEIPARDEAGFRALSDLEGRGVGLVANALAQSVDHVVSFFRALRVELAFYLGCVTLHERLAAAGRPVCFPEPVAAGESALSARGLYDACLALTVDGPVVGNDLDADGTSLVFVTGANQGGKSTILRGVGLAQLMMQSGMFVAAESLRATVCGGVFTHFKRAEDPTMTSGKLDEELARMSELADHLAPGDLLLCNESFAATNEREGSEIARQVVRALTAAGVRVVFVTHLYDLAHGFYRQRPAGVVFLRAERRPDGRRTFRLVPGEPLPTSHGADSYRRIFGESHDTEPTAAVSRG